MAELKAEKERLESLSREKSHADKLKGRISDLNSTIAAKEVEYEETKKQYESLVEANQKFYDYATKFRELYLEIKNLQEKKERFETELTEAKLNLQEVVGTQYTFPISCFVLTAYPLRHGRRTGWTVEELRRSYQCAKAEKEGRRYQKARSRR